MIQRIGVGKVRHLEVRYLWTQEALRDGRSSIRKLDSATKKADIATKWVSREVMKRICDRLPMRSSSRWLTEREIGALMASTLVESMRGADAAETGAVVPEQVGALVEEQSWSMSVLTF